MGWREIMVLKMKYTAVLFVVMVTMAASQSVDNQQLECDMKKLAVQYAEDLLPNHEGVSKLVQDALQIQNVCGDGDTLDHVERERPASAHKHDHCTVFDVNKCDHVIYVDPNGHGDEDNDGNRLNVVSSFPRPFVDLETAIGAVLIGDGDGDDHRSHRHRCIILRGGHYHLKKTISLLGIHTSLTIARYQCEDVIVSGGIPLSNLQWSHHDHNILKAKLPGNFRIETGTALYDLDSGLRYTRARYPNADAEREGLHTRDHTGWIPSAKSWGKSQETGEAIEIVVDTPKRTMEHEVYSSFQIGIGGPASRYNPPQSYWALNKPVGGGASTVKIPSSLEFKDGEFEGRKWKNPQTGIVHAFQQSRWGSWQFHIDEVQGNHIKFGRGGFQEARGGAKGAEYYVENLFEELDSRGEYFFDSDTHHLYFYTNTTHSDRYSMRLVASNLKTLLRIESSSNIEVIGVRFAHSHFTFLDDFEVPSGGDIAVHRGGAVEIENSNAIAIDRSVFDRLNGNALYIGGASANCSITNSEFKWIGEHAILLLGRSSLVDGITQAQFPQGTLIEANLIREVGIYNMAGAAICQSVAYRSVIRHNVMFNGPRAGINLYVVEQNLGFNVVRASSDHGVFNSWDRQPYLSSSKRSMYPEFTVMKRNYFISNYGSTWPIDHDDGSVNYLDTKNVLLYGGFKNFLGHSKIASHKYCHLRHMPHIISFYPIASFIDSLYIYPDHIQEKAMYYPQCASSSNMNGQQAQADVFAFNTCYQGKGEDIYSFGDCTIYGMGWGSLHDSNELRMPKTMKNTYFTADGEMTVKCGDKVLSLKEFQKLGYDIGTNVRQDADITRILAHAHSLLYPITRPYNDHHHHTKLQGLEAEAVAMK